MLEKIKNSPTLLGIIAAVSAAPYIYAEYRRIKLELFDTVYWILAALLLVSAVCIYLILIPKFMEGYDRMSDEEREAKHMEPFTVKCNCAAVVSFIVAAFAFLVSGVIALI